MHNLLNLKSKDYRLYIACNYAPRTLQELAAALFGFVLEVSKTVNEASEPMVARIKIEWWRNAFTEIQNKQPARPHPILLTLKQHNIALDYFLEILHRYDDLIEDIDLSNLQNLKNFLLQTECMPFKIMSEVLQVNYDENLALAYCLAKYNKLPEALEILPKRNKTVFAIMAKNYKKPLYVTIARLIVGNYKFL